MNNFCLIKNSMKLVYVLVCSMFSFNDVTNGQQTDTCSRVTRFVNDLGMELTQGPPGKRGPQGPVGGVGLKGQKGETGDPPQCVCSQNRFAALEQQTTTLQSKLRL